MTRELDPVSQSTGNSAMKGASGDGPDAGGTGSGKPSDFVTTAVIAFYLLGFFFFALKEKITTPLETLVTDNPWSLLAAPAALFVLVVALWVLVKRFRGWSDAIKGLVVTIGAVPLLVMVLNAIALLPESWRDRTLVVLFVLAAAILPPAMYYLFLVTRRPSLFDEYVTNLVRLRLIPAPKREVDAYLQKFEATYGPIEPDKRRKVLEELAGMTTDPGADGSAANGTGDGWGRRYLETRVGSLMTPSILLPLGLSTLVVAIGWMLVLPIWEAVSLLDPVQTAVGFGFIGAYFYSVQFLFRRFLRRDLRPSVYISMGQRVVLTVLATWVLAALLSASDAASPKIATSQLLVLAFLIGMFPRLLWDVLMTGLARVTGPKQYLERMKPKLPLSRVDGLSFWHESRLEEEDVESAPNLATADMVELMLNTRFAPGRIIDWIDQAILVTALGPSDNGHGAKLREHGIRTASALLESYERSREDPHNDAKKFEGILGRPHGRSAIRTLADALVTNPNLRLVRNWQKSMDFGIPKKSEETSDGKPDASHGRPAAPRPLDDSSFNPVADRRATAAAAG